MTEALPDEDKASPGTMPGSDNPGRCVDVKALRAVFDATFANDDPSATPKAAKAAARSSWRHIQDNVPTGFAVTADHVWRDCSLDDNTEFEPIAI